MRPVLLRRNRSGDALQNLRYTYATAIDTHEHRLRLFDGLKFVPYCDFVRFGKLPGYSDGYTQDLSKDSWGPYWGGGLIIFISYRWINKVGGVSNPDDDDHTQYKRMLSAIEEFLTIHPSIDPKQLGVWIVRQMLHPTLHSRHSQ